MIQNRLKRIIIGAVLLVIALVLETNFQGLNIALYLASYLIVGGDVIRKAFRNIIRARLLTKTFNDCGHHWSHANC